MFVGDFYNYHTWSEKTSIYFVKQDKSVYVRQIELSGEVILYQISLKILINNLINCPLIPVPKPVR